MGTKIGPGYANVFVGFIEQFFDKFEGTKPELAATLTIALARHLAGDTSLTTSLHRLILFIRL